MTYCNQTSIPLLLAFEGGHLLENILLTPRIQQMVFSKKGNIVSTTSNNDTTEQLSQGPSTL